MQSRSYCCLQLAHDTLAYTLVLRPRSHLGRKLGSSVLATNREAPLKLTHHEPSLRVVRRQCRTRHGPESELSAREVVSAFAPASAHSGLAFGDPARSSRCPDAVTNTERSLEGLNRGRFPVTLAGYREYP